MTPAHKVRGTAGLLELVRVLARQAAREGLQEKGGSFGESQPPGKEPCHQAAAAAHGLKRQGRGKDYVGE